MDKMKMLNEEQLDNVSGGGNCASPNYLPSTHGAHIYASDLADHPENYINQKFYCVYDASESNYLIVTFRGAKRVSTAGRGYSTRIQETIWVNEIHSEIDLPDIYGNTMTLNGVCTIAAAQYTFYALG